MISSFQGWIFQRWRQASLWTTKKIRRQRIRDITRRKSESNARGACRIIRGNSTSRFCTIESHGNDLKTRKLSVLWTETERLWKAIFHLRIADSKTTEKRFFCIELWLEMRSGYSTITPRRKNTTLSPINRCRPQHQHHGRTFIRRSYSVSDGQKGFVYYELLKPGDSIMIGYNWSFEPCIARKTTGIRAKTKLFFFMTTLGLMSLKS